MKLSKLTPSFFVLILTASCTLGGEDLPVNGGATDSSPKVLAENAGISNFYTIGVDTLPSTPGVLLRKEPLLPHQSVPGASQGIRVLYTSTDGLDGETIVAVSGSVFLPQGVAPKHGWPVILWSHGTVGIADKCAPSWTGYVPFHDEYLKQWLDQGYAIVASDYQGLGTAGTHPYLATRPAAYSNLDIIRSSKSLNLNLSSKIIVVGQSQGAGAAIATAGYAPDYAPEVNLRGVVATGVPFFSPATLIAIQEARPKDKIDPMLGYNFLALTLVEQLLPDFRIEDYVFDATLPTAQAVRGVCNKDMRKRIQQEGLTYNSTFKKSPAKPLEVAFSQMGFPTMNISVPVYIGVGATDPRYTAKNAGGIRKESLCSRFNIASTFV